MNKLLPYIIARLSESSTWRGIILVLTAFGAKLEPTQWEAIVTSGLAVAGLIAIAFPDVKKPADQGPDPGV